MNLKDAAGAATSRLTHPTACHSGAKATLGSGGFAEIIGGMQEHYRASAAQLTNQLGGPEVSHGIGL